MFWKQAKSNFLIILITFSHLVRRKISINSHLLLTNHPNIFRGEDVAVSMQEASAEKNDVNDDDGDNVLKLQIYMVLLSRRGKFRIHLLGVQKANMTKQ